MPDVAIPVLPPEEAIAFFVRKGLAKSFAWQDIWTAQHDYFFTVAKMLEVSLLEEVHGLIGEALNDGRSPQQLGKDLKELLRARGWWGKQLRTDPLDGEQKVVQLGSNRRVRTIVNTNLRTSYSAGRYARQERVKHALPILVYKSRMDGKERPQHHAWHNIALAVDDAWWKSHYPPCDWGCRCRTVSMTLGQAERRGLKIGEKPPYFGTRTWANKRTGEVMEIEKGIGAGWDYHPGRAQLEGIAPDPLFGFSKVDGDESAIAAAEPTATARFLKRFGLPEAGGVWRDAAGWPLGISRAWMMGLSSKQQQLAAAASLAITSPDEIRLVWVRGKDKRAMLMRRYILAAGRAGFVIDVGSSVWRFAAVAHEGLDRARASGTPIWTRESEAEASYNSRQPRDRNGRWTSGGASFIAMAIADNGFVGTHFVGNIGGHVRERLQQLGLPSSAKSVMLESGRARHAIKRHGKDGRGQKPVGAPDLLSAHHVLNAGRITRGHPMHSPNGAPRIFATAQVEHHRIGATFEVGKRKINLITMWKK